MNESGHAVVIGSGIGGLVMATVAARHFERVSVIERDELETRPGPRRGVPQGRHAHALLASGKQALDRLLPGITTDLTAAGAVLGSPPSTMGPYLGGHVGIQSVFGTRSLIESVVRARVVALDNVELLSGWSVGGLLIGGEGVAGVTIQHGELDESIPADLVIDCSGRHARTLKWLEEHGHRSPPMSTVHIDVGYRTVVVDRRIGDLGDLDSLLALCDPPNMGVAVLPIEDDRWIITEGGWHGNHPPREWAGFVEFADRLSLPVVSRILERSEPQDVVTYRFHSSQRRHFERLRDPVPGHLVAADGISSFNPVYGQGMSVAALEAEVLDDALSRFGAQGNRFARYFYRKATRVVDNPWTIAASADFALSETIGAKPPGTDLTNRYLRRYQQACRHDPKLATQMLLVQNLLATPQSLMRPDRMLRVFRRPSRPYVEERQPVPV